MKKQLLNLKMIALMCLMMVLGGANVWAADKITDVANIVSGGKYYIGATTSNGDDWYLKIDGTSIGSGIKGVPTKSISEGAIFIIEKNGNSWNLKFDGTNNYLALGSSNSQLDVVSTAKAFTFANKSGLIYMTSKAGSTDRALKRNSNAGTLYFGSYRADYLGPDVWLMPATPAKPLTSLAISGQPKKTTYNVGEEFDPTGLVVTGTYDDNTTAPITNGITWTKNPETMSLGNTSCTVTASVGEVKSEPFVVNGLNVVNAIVFDFTKDWEGITATAPSNNGNQKNGEQVVAGKELKVDGVVMTATNGKSTNNITYYTGLYKNKRGQNLRVYVNGSLTFTAPEGYNLSEVTFTGSTTDEFTTADEAYKDPTWTGNAHSVTFTASGGVQVKTVTIKLVATAEPTYTPATVNFVAHSGDNYYATFSNENVVFMPKDVTVSAVTVDNNNVVMRKSTEGVLGTEEIVKIEGADVAGYYIPANTGVLLNSKNSGEVTYYTVENKEVAPFDAKLNMLMPSVAGGEFTAEPGKVYYKLAYNDYNKHEGLGFYWGAPEGGKFFVKAGTAYLAVPEANATGAKGFTLNGEATGIEGVNANLENAKAIYNLNGQRVASMAKPGLYIVNGKKVVRK